MANVKMGWEGRIYYGAAGSTAATQLTNVRDIKLDLDIKEGDTTVRGDSSVAPIETSAVASRVCGVEFDMIRDTTDASLAAMMQAAADGTGIALRLKDHATGLGPDADFNVKLSDEQPLAGEQKISFTATPSRSCGRAPLNWV
jgi:hypothetical protein